MAGCGLQFSQIGYAQDMETEPSGAAGKRAGRRIRQLRLERSLTQADLAERLAAFDRSYTVSTLSRIEQGKRRLDADDVVAIAAALGVSLDSLLLEAHDLAQGDPPEVAGRASTNFPAGLQVSPAVEPPYGSVYPFGEGGSLLADSMSDAWSPFFATAAKRPDALDKPPSRRASEYQPWSWGQVRVVGSWPTRRDQPVSVALSPAGDRLALSAGQRLSVSDITDSIRAQTLFTAECALAPGLTWSPGGDRLAFRDETGQGRLVELPASGAGPRTSVLGAASAVAFTPDGDELAVLVPSLPGRMTLMLMTPQGEVIWRQELARNPKSSYYPEGANLAVSPGGGFLACTTGTSQVWVFETATGRLVREFDGHSQTVAGLGWFDEERIVSAAGDATLQIWGADESIPVTVVETIPAAGMVFARERRTALIWSVQGEMLAWSLEGAVPVQLWDREPPPRSAAAQFTRLAASAVDGLLALVDAGGTDLVLVSDWTQVVNAPPATTTYANAKVLVLGDSGVGKSGLAMVLAGGKFAPTESTHGRRIWRLPAADPAADEQETSGDSREVMLWDLAGQPGYRIVHQLHLEGAALALILFDAKSETTPLAGIRHWAHAVRHAHPAAGGGLPAFLVAARADRGGINVSDQRIQKLMTRFGLTQYFKTSAKEQINTDLLRSRLLAAIDWSRIPEVTSTALFAAVKKFVMEQRSSVLLTPINELGRLFQAEVPSGVQLMTGQESASEPAGDSPPELSPAGLTSVFEGCIARLESAGLVKRLKFADYVLLQPELLDAYAGAMVNAARDEPDGLGSIPETKVVNVDFHVPATERVRDQLQERLLVLATLEELLLRELVLREPTKEGVQLVFPSAYRRDLPTSEMPKGDGVVFRFEGPVENVYATLIVRLTRSDRFRRIDTWQSAARFAAEQGTCIVALRFEAEGEAELSIGYDRVTRDIRKQFERFVHTHLERWATPGTIIRERQYSCPDCGLVFSQEMVREVLRRGRLSILCPVCEKRVLLLDDYEENGADQSIAQMDASADAGREIEAATAVLRGKTAVLRGKEDVAEYDVFLSYNWQDKEAVRAIARQLRERGLRPWMDERQLRPGALWQPELEKIIARVPAAAVVIGAQHGPWQNREMYAFIQQSVNRGCAIVPVLLPDADTADLPVFLQGLTWVNLGVPESDPIDQLVWGITGQQPSRHIYEEPDSAT
jgi:GTPase SAR1 family protein/transcriptional regulator with XRE-family HTH domain/nucleotide-binding universal stress UspA family protein